MDPFEFDDTKTSGIWWATNVAIRDACIELKEETSCEDKEIISLLTSIASSIKENGI